MADMTNIFEQAPNLTAEEIKMIEYFAQGQKHSMSSRNLKLEYTETSIRLSTVSGKLLGITKQTNEWRRKALVTNSSIYRNRIIQDLLERGYITLQKSSHPDFTEYHHYRVPSGYKLNYTEIIQLWIIWWHNRRDRINANNVSIDIQIFTKGNWHRVRDLQPRQGNFAIATAVGELAIAPEDYVVWLERADAQQVAPAVRADANPRTEEVARSAASPQDVDESSADREELDLESYLNTFNTETTEDIDRIEGIYNIGELLSSADSEQVDEPVEPSTSVEQSTTTNPSAERAPSILSLQQKQSLKLKAISALSKYLAEGDVVTLTEVVKNARGQEIDRKITTIQRGCPRWVIEQIQRLE